MGRRMSFPLLWKEIQGTKKLGMKRKPDPALRYSELDPGSPNLVYGVRKALFSGWAIEVPGLFVISHLIFQLIKPEKINGHSSLITIISLLAWKVFSPTPLIWVISSGALKP